MVILSLLPYSACECRRNLQLLIFYIKVMPVQFVFCCYPGKTITQFSSPLQASCASYICFFSGEFSFSPVESGMWDVPAISWDAKHFHSHCVVVAVKTQSWWERKRSFSVQLFSLTLSFRLTHVFRMIHSLSWSTRGQPAVPSTWKVARLLLILQVLWLFPDSLITWLHWDKNTNMAKGKSHINVPICS